MAEFIELTKTSIGVGENSIKQKCLVNVGKISHIDPTDGTWEKAYIQPMELGRRHMT